MNLKRTLQTAAVGTLGALTLFSTGCSPRYDYKTVNDGALKSGVEYRTQNEAPTRVREWDEGRRAIYFSDGLTIVTAPIRKGDEKVIDFLQSYCIFDCAGNHILEDTDYERCALANPSYWPQISIKNTALRAEAIARANEVSAKEGWGVEFREGSPTLLEAEERRNKKK